MGNAVLQMIAECLLLDAVQGGTYRADLGQHVNAVAVLLDHARDTANLAFNATEPGKLRFFQFIIHDLTIPL